MASNIEQAVAAAFVDTSSPKKDDPEEAVTVMTRDERALERIRKNKIVRRKPKVSIMVGRAQRGPRTPPVCRRASSNRTLLRTRCGSITPSRTFRTPQDASRTPPMKIPGMSRRLLVPLVMLPMTSLVLYVPLALALPDSVPLVLPPPAYR